MVIADIKQHKLQQKFQGKCFLSDAVTAGVCDAGCTGCRWKSRPDELCLLLSLPVIALSAGALLGLWKHRCLHRSRQDDRRHKDQTRHRLISTCEYTICRQRLSEELGQASCNVDVPGKAQFCSAKGSFTRMVLCCMHSGDLTVFKPR